MCTDNFINVRRHNTPANAAVTTSITYATQFTNNSGKRPLSPHSSLITHRTAFFCSFTYSGFHSAVSKCPGAR